MPVAKKIFIHFSIFSLLTTFKVIIVIEKYRRNLIRKRLETKISFGENRFKAKTVEDAANKEKTAIGNTNFLGITMAILLKKK